MEINATNTLEVYVGIGLVLGLVLVVLRSKLRKWHRASQAAAARRREQEAKAFAKKTRGLSNAPGQTVTYTRQPFDSYEIQTELVNRSIKGIEIAEIVLSPDAFDDILEARETDRRFVYPTSPVNDFSYLHQGRWIPIKMDPKQTINMTLVGGGR